MAFTDLASNDGATVTALTAGSGVTIDLTAPSLTTVTMVSSNTGDGTLANAGDTITVSLTADEAILAPTVTIAGQSATVSGSGTSYTAIYTVQGSQVASLDGNAASVSVAFADVSGNAGTPVTALTSGGGVTIDLTPPTLPSVTIASDNSADTTRANAGDPITLTITASEALVSPTVTIAGSSATVSGTGTSYTATYTVVSSDDEGFVGVAVGFADIAGNVGATLTSTTSSANRVYIDLSPPTLSSVQIASTNTASSLWPTQEIRSRWRS